jgi:peptide-methionine (R)-S-oxide reductase
MKIFVISLLLLPAGRRVAMQTPSMIDISGKEKVVAVKVQENTAKERVVNMDAEKEKDEKVVLPDRQWRQKLTEEQYRILRLKGTEKPFSGEYDKHFEEGVYVCAGCGNKLFTSETKFDSGCGWPSFYEPMEDSGVTESADRSYNMVRTEITCSECGGHLGHVFNDGPRPTGLRYCINSAALDFKKGQ